MTVGELRKALEGVADEMVVLTYDHGYLSEEFVSANVERCAPLPGGHFEVIWEHSGHPEGTAGVRYLVIS